MPEWQTGLHPSHYDLSFLTFGSISAKSLAQFAPK
jgi:hypothetical protein